MNANGSTYKHRDCVRTLFNILYFPVSKIEAIFISMTLLRGKYEMNKKIKTILVTEQVYDIIV